MLLTYGRLVVSKAHNWKHVVVVVPAAAAADGDDDDDGDVDTV